MWRGLEQPDKAVGARGRFAAGNVGELERHAELIEMAGR